MPYTDRPSPDEYAPFYGGYVARVPAGDIVQILRDQIADTRALLEAMPPAQADFAYAPGKWTVKEVLGHMADTERTMSYRALRFARGDATPLAGFSETDYVAAANFASRTTAELLDDLGTVRRASVALFAALPPEAWTRRGTANGKGVSVRALACIIAGHALHHRALLRERYGVGEATVSPPATS